jgi:hypothetical protein
MNETVVSAAPRPEKQEGVVLCSGLATSALALFGIYLINRTTDDVNIMGWYANYVIPIGAILVGLVAGSGYGVASWVTGVRITKRLLWIVLILQVLSYFAAEHIQFASLGLLHEDGTKVGFFEYYDMMARSFAWKQKDGSMGQPLGAWGYFFQALAVIGFCVGGVIVPAILKAHPYCQNCQIYMRKKALGFIPAGIPAKKIKKTDTAALAEYASADEAVAREAQVRLEQLVQWGKDGNTAEFTAFIRDLATHKKETAKLPRRIGIELVSCKSCWSGYLRTTMYVGLGEDMKVTELGHTPVTDALAREVSMRG